MHVCTGSTPFINFCLKRCPNLRELVERKSPKRPSAIGSSQRIDRALSVYERLLVSLRNHHGLLTFESSTLLSEMKVLKEAGMSPSQNMQLILNDREMQGLFLRNQNGCQKCSAAIYQLLLIKRYRPDSVFRFINKDVVMIIAKLIYKTMGTAAWSQ